MATVVGTRDPLWTAPYLDVDTARDGEVPNQLEMEIREAATPAGSGTLVDRRCSRAAAAGGPEQLLGAYRTGRQLHALTSATDWSADANVTVTTYATNAPTGYANATSLDIQATGGSSSDREARYYFPEPLDLSVYPSGQPIRVHRRFTSATNLGQWLLTFFFSAGYATFKIVDPADALNTWAEASVSRENATQESGTVDWSDVTGIALRADVSGAYTGNLRVRDLRIGLCQTDKTSPDGHPAWEASYDVRVRYRDDATLKVGTTLAAASIAGATNVKVASVTDLAAGDELSIETAGLEEVRTIATVGTSGSGGTGVTVTEAFSFAHGSGDTVHDHYWGPWTGWLTVKTSEPPGVTLSSPADASTQTTPVPALSWSESSPAGKTMASRTVRIYETVGGSDRLIHAGSAESGDLVPYLLLEAAGDYAWEVELEDSEGLTTTSERWTFTTDVAEPGALTNPAATIDEDASAVTLTWDAAGGDFAFYVVRWLDGNGQWVRVDEGPRALDDGRSPLTDATFTWHGARLGDNLFQVTAHAGGVGPMESEPVTVSIELTPPAGGSWMFVRPDVERHTFPFRALQSVPRVHQAATERFSPPGRGSTIHLKWGATGKRVSVRTQRRPADDGDLSMRLDELQSRDLPGWLKAPSGWVWDPMWCQVVEVTDEPGLGGLLGISIEFEETDRT